MNLTPRNAARVPLWAAAAARLIRSAHAPAHVTTTGFQGLQSGAGSGMRDVCDTPVRRRTRPWGRQGLPPALRRAARRVTTVVAVTVLTLGFAVAPASADPAVDDDEMQLLRSRLFSATMRAKDPGLNGLKDLVLSVGLLSYRSGNPDATYEQMVAQAAAMRDALNVQLTADVPARDYYQYFMKGLDAVSGVPGVSIGTPFVKGLLEVTLGADLQAEGHLADQVTGAFQAQAWMAKYYVIQDLVWGDVMRSGLRDRPLGTAWDAVVGVNVNLSVQATIEQMSRDPMIGAYLNTDAILANQGDMNGYLNEIRRQALEALDKINEQNEQIRAELEAMSLQYPVGLGKKPAAADYTAAKRAAADRQAGIDALGSAVYILSTLAGFVDPKLGKDLGIVGTAAVNAATAINQYLPTIAGLGLSDALLSLTTLTLTGNLLGAAISLAPLFGLGQPDPQQLILDQLAAIRDDIAQLSTQMNDRFDRVEQGLTQLYADMLVEFDRLLQETAEVRQSITDIQRQLILLENRIDALSAYLTEAFREDLLDAPRSMINMYIDYEGTYGKQIPSYGEYTKPENEFHFTATQRSIGATVTLTKGFDTADPITQLDTYGAAGLIDYLSWLARDRGYDPDFPQPATNTPNASIWLLGARASNALQLQNPDYAEQVKAQRTADIIAAGERINDASRAFSRPGADARTNILFKNLLNNHEQAMARLGAELTNIGKNDVLKGKSWSLWADPIEQNVPPAGYLPAGPTGAMPACHQGAAVALPNVPSAIPYSSLPAPYLLLNYALDSGEQPTFSVCYDVEFVNEIWQAQPSYLETQADLRVTVRIFVQWSNGPRFEARAVSHTGSAGVVCREWYNKPEFDFCKTPQDVMHSSWSATRKESFEAAPNVVTHSTATDATADKARNFVHGKRKYYYDLVSSRLVGGTTLAAANREVTEAMRLLQAYSELGWAQALQNDDLMHGLLYGSRRIPADLAGSRPVADVYQHAANVYTACRPVVPAGPCQTADPDTYDLKHPDYDWSKENCEPLHSGPIAGVPEVDPIGSCAHWQGTQRRNLLEAQYDQQSDRLFHNLYREGNPDVEVVMSALTVTSRAVHG
ncbi:hypothetical protein [Catellatospora sichuanensis]|uniref:hypothetical protein n=1 Tax=Catellatospora sichuanensis TaxID=1969805 RepID=UPI001183E4B5|nr:hypothetical protein [Catellatospora sichuanensis]